MNPSTRDSAMDPVRAAARRMRSLRAVCWMLAGVAFLLGPVVGLTMNAEFGAAIWVSSAVLALLPFASHRHYG